VYLKNTEEKWKRKEDRLTSNQAELLGVMSAISIADQKGYKNVLIYTDSKFVVGCTEIDTEGNWKWKIKSGNVMEYVARLREMLTMIPNLKIEHIPREKNYAHAV
jgi:ribonuclease HI